MHTFWSAIFILAFVAAASDASPTYQLVWADEFSGTTINMTNWSYYLGIHATGANINTAESVMVKGGNLVITPTCQNGDIYSGRVETKRKVTMTQGRLEVRAKMPFGNWLWPAIWLWSQGGFTNELDLVEMAGYEPNMAEGSVHLYSANKSNPLVSYSNQRYTLLFDTTEDFHVYAMNWTSDTVSYSVDDIQIGSVNYKAMLPSENLSSDQMFVVLNAAVGGYYFGPEVPKDDATLCTDSSKWTPMLVDYARIYRDISREVATTETAIQITTQTIPPQNTHVGNIWITKNSFASKVQASFFCCLSLLILSL
ncbi:hypothetical protein HDU98_009934 [Podochytrium sp. JEL0797]|nr:hypothetical protein HDU98_009934 [Podochytrium sp. JEL0797]